MAALRPKMMASESQPSWLVDVNTFDAIDIANRETGIYNECDVTTVAVDNNEQRQTTSGVTGCSLLADKSAAASRSRSFTIDAILGGQHLHQISTDNDDDDSADASCMQVAADIEAPVDDVDKNSSPVTPMDCSRLKAGCQMNSNNSNVFPVDCASRNVVVSRNSGRLMFDSSSLDGTRSSDQFLNGHIPGELLPLRVHTSPYDFELNIFVRFYRQPKQYIATRRSFTV